MGGRAAALSGSSPLLLPLSSRSFLLFSLDGSRGWWCCIPARSRVAVPPSWSSPWRLLIRRDRGGGEANKDGSRVKRLGSSTSASFPVSASFSSTGWFPQSGLFPVWVLPRSEGCGGGQISISPFCSAL